PKSNGLEILIEDVDRAAAEIGGVKKSVAGGIRSEREALVDRPRPRMVDGQKGSARIHDSGPTKDVPILRGEQETAGRGNAVFRDGKPRPAVENRSGRRPGRLVLARQRDNKWQRRPASVQQIRDTIAVVGEPKRARRTE